MNIVEVLVDNSAITASACARKYQLACVYGAQGHRGSDPIVGNSFHGMAEFVVKNPDATQEQLQEAVITVANKYGMPDYAKLSRLTMGFRGVRRKMYPVYIRPQDGAVAAEIKFKEHYKDIIKGDTTYKIYLCGTIDYIGHDASQIYPYDYKSFSGVKGKDKLDEYTLSFQLVFYSIALKRWAYKILGAGPAADLAAAGRICARFILVLHNLPSPDFKFGEGLTFNEDYMEEGLRIIDNRIDEMISVWELGAEPAFRDGLTNGACKYCDFKIACLMRDKAREAAFVDRLPKMPYNPLAFR